MMGLMKEGQVRAILTRLIPNLRPLYALDARSIIIRRCFPVSCAVHPWFRQISRDIRLVMALRNVQNLPDHPCRQ